MKFREITVSVFLTFLIISHVNNSLLNLRKTESVEIKDLSPKRIASTESSKVITVTLATEYSGTFDSAVFMFGETEQFTITTITATDDKTIWTIDISSQPSLSLGAYTIKLNYETVNTTSTQSVLIYKIGRASCRERV